jgi:predicted metal-binding transcription factor (methanogenesis marker protein 9)
MFFYFTSKKNPSVVNLRDDKLNRFFVDSGYSPELVRICKSIKKSQWDPAIKKWLLHKDYYYEFKQKIADKLKIELDLNEEEVIKRKVIVEELNKKYLVRNDVAVTVR